MIWGQGDLLWQGTSEDPRAPLAGNLRPTQVNFSPISSLSVIFPPQLLSHVLPLLHCLLATPLATHINLCCSQLTGGWSGQILISTTTRSVKLSKVTLFEFWLWSLVTVTLFLGGTLAEMWWKGTGTRTFYTTGTNPIWIVQDVDCDVSVPTAVKFEATSLWSQHWLDWIDRRSDSLC